jgi:hypothetical protein
VPILQCALLYLYIPTTEIKAESRTGKNKTYPIGLKNNPFLNLVPDLVPIYSNVE